MKLLKKALQRILFINVLISVIVFAGGCRFKENKNVHLKKSFKNEIKSIVKQYNLPGMTAAYILKDGTIEVFAAGLSDIEQKIPMTVKTIMPAASTGKTFTGAAILALVQEGLLDLDVPVQRYLEGEKWFPRVPNSSDITLRHLLTHSSGIGDHVYSKKFAEAFRKSRGIHNEVLQPRDLVSFIFDTSPLFEAGKEFHYSDTGYIIAGLIIEKVTGRSFYEVITEFFIQPLGLSKTQPSNKIIFPGIASGYLSEKNIFNLPAKTTTHPDVMAWNPGIEWAGGGFISCPRDLVVWARDLYQGSAIQGSYLNDLTQGVRVRKSVRYGIATVIYNENERGLSFGHSGWIPGYCSNVRYYKKIQTAIAFQINTDRGIIDSSKNVLHDVEVRLARIVFNPAEKI